MSFGLDTAEKYGPDGISWNAAELG